MPSQEKTKTKLDVLILVTYINSQKGWKSEKNPDIN